MSTSTKQEQTQYKNFANANTPHRPIVRNTVRAFVVGGLICTVGEGVQGLFVRYGNFSERSAGDPTVAVMILLSVILTALGVYDRFAQWAGAGSAVPVTGFANTMASAAMEHRSEGWVTGVGGNMFKLAGAVVVFGVVSAFCISLIRFVVAHILQIG